MTDNEPDNSADIHGIKDWIIANKGEIVITIIVVLVSIVGIVSYTKSTIPKPKKI